MIERLEATLTKYNQLQTELMSEDVLKNINKTREISKEIADLEEVVNEYKRYKKVLHLHIKDDISLYDLIKKQVFILKYTLIWEEIK